MTVSLKRWLLRYVAILCGICLLLGPLPRYARAQFAVHDPLNFAVLGKIWSQDISTGAKIIEEVNQLTRIYTQGYQMYMLAQMMSTSLTHGQRGLFMTLVQMAVNDATRNKYGETVMWPMMMNGSPLMAPQAWATSTIPMTGLGMGMPTSITDPRLMNVLMAHIATVEIADGSSSKCLQAIGQYRANSAVNQGPTQALQLFQFSDDPTVNSEIQQLNMLNAGTSQSINETRAHGDIQSCAVEQQVIANKVQRDSIANNLTYAAHAQTALAANPYDWDGGLTSGSFQLQ